MKDSVIFYFSGTGNSLQVAKDIADGLGDTELINLGDFDFDSEITAKRIGIVYPVYCWGPPVIIARFAEKMQVNGDAYIYQVATYGGIPGAALKMVKQQLNQRNITLNAAYKIQMPGNYIVGYGARNEKSQLKSFAKEKASVAKITYEIKSDSTNLKAANVNPIGTALFVKIYKKLMTDVHNQDKNFNINSDCTGCGICEKSCPVHNISIEDKKPVWHHNCELCVSCIQHCPKEAINFNDKTQNRKRYVNKNV
jgi:ferredoxin